MAALRADTSIKIKPRTGISAIVPADRRTGIRNAPKDLDLVRSAMSGENVLSALERAERIIFLRLNKDEQSLSQL
ncbi:MAG: hypothetical protein AB7G93_01310 [Bdellovibrionales bacterium]